MMTKNDMIVCNVVDIVMDNELIPFGYRPLLYKPQNDKELLEQRIVYLKYLIKDLENELEEIESLEEAEKYI